MSRLVVLNRKNWLNFAENLYAVDDDGTIHYVPLCYGNLAATNDEGPISCALGEAYYHFIDHRPPMIGTETAIAILTQSARLNNEFGSFSAFSRELAEAVKINDKYLTTDDDDADSETNQIRRAKNVQEKFIEMAEYLK